MEEASEELRNGHSAHIFQNQFFRNIFKQQFSILLDIMIIHNDLKDGFSYKEKKSLQFKNSRLSFLLYVQ